MRRSDGSCQVYSHNYLFSLLVKARQQRPVIYFGFLTSWNDKDLTVIINIIMIVRVCIHRVAVLSTALPFFSACFYNDFIYQLSPKPLKGGITSDALIVILPKTWRLPTWPLIDAC